MKGGGRKKAQNEAVEAGGEREVKKRGAADPNADRLAENKEGEADGQQEKEKEEERNVEGEGEEEGEDEEAEAEAEAEGEVEGEGNVAEEEQEERPKLDEGFFEIEAIRRKRVRKGHLQYLIKWRGWPETANTWEPLENLQSCSDVIDAFEESLRSGKPGRKRRRKYGGSHSQSKKKQPRTSAATSVDVSDVDKSLVLVPLENASLADHSALNQVPVSHVVENDGKINDVIVANQANENGSANGSNLIDLRKEVSGHNTKLSELKGAIPSNGFNDKVSLHFQEGKASEGDGIANGLPKEADHVEPVQINRRTGAKRRKSGTVKRFKQDPALSEQTLTQNSTPNIPTGYGLTDAQIEIDYLGLPRDNPSHGPRMDHSINSFSITKIIRPVECTADTDQEVIITFLAVRSDGKEVMVDNKFLKVNNPLLLINFYEQHIKYGPSR